MSLRIVGLALALAFTLGFADPALAATRSTDTYLAAQYARLRPRRGHKKALGAVKHSIMIQHPLEIPRRT